MASQPGSSLLGKLQSGLDFLDGAFKEAVEKGQEEGEEGHELLEEVAAQRCQRRQRLDAAGKAAPFGSALAANTPAGSVNNDDKAEAEQEEEGEMGRVLSASLTGGSSTKPAVTPVRMLTPPMGEGLVMTPAAAAVGAGGEADPSTTANDNDDAALFQTALKAPLYTPAPSSSNLDTTPQGQGARRLSLSSSSSSGRRAASLLGGGIGGGGDPVEQQLRQLRREVKELNEENAECERRILGQERELKAAAEALAHTNAKAAARESELLDELRELRKAKDVDRGQYQAALASRATSIEELEKEVVGVKTELDTARLQVEALRKEVAASLEEREALRADLAVARSNQERGVEGLRQELRAAETQIDEMKAHHAGWLRQAQFRESELEGTNAQLTESLAALQREVEGWKVKAEAASQGGVGGQSEEELRRVQQELQAAQGALEMERRHVVSLQREVRAQQHELSAAQAAWREEKEGSDARLGKATARQQELETALAEVQKSLAEARERGGSKEEMEGRLRMLSEQLVKKQSALDALACDKYAVEARLAAAEQRAGALEIQVAELTGGRGGGGYGDLDGAVSGDLEALTLRNRGGSSTMPPSSTSKTAISTNSLLPTTSPSSFHRKFHPNSATGGLRPLSRLPFCQARPQLAAAADGLDRLVASALHGLRAHPALRLAFLGYLLALHVWAFGLLAFHSQRIEAVHADVGGSGAGPTLMGVGLGADLGGE